MSVHRQTSLDFIHGISTSLPCCLVFGNTAVVAEPRPQEVCVALGGGTGANIQELSQAVGNEGVVYCVEMSKDILGEVQRRLTGKGLENIEYLHSIFEDIALWDGAADLIVSDCSFALSQEKERVWDEVYRILKPGGRFVVCDVISDKTVPSTRGDRCRVELLTKEIYLNLLDEKGFGGITIIEESLQREAEHLLGPLMITGIVVSGHRPLNDVLSGAEKGRDGSWWGE
jgi:SAM-dependent methyltransferase